MPLHEDVLGHLETLQEAGTVGFKSTRKKAKGGFFDTLKQGSASDGGLFVPESFPALPEEFIENLDQYSPAEVASVLLRSFLPEDVPNEQLLEMAQAALNFNIPLELVDKYTFLLRLDQGPTASFKDIAARQLAQFMELYCERTGERINLLVATSGDTGVAIAEAFGGSKFISVTILYPAGGVSPVQEFQMLDADKAHSNVQAKAIKGSFDNAQDTSKILQSMRGLSAENKDVAEKRIEDITASIREKLGASYTTDQVAAMAKKVDSINLSSANSINIWRLLPQMTQFFVGYGHMQKHRKEQAKKDHQRYEPQKEVVFSVPTGNVGHLMAGIYAKEMGLPIRSFIAATNANNILAYMIGKGRLEHRGFRRTSSPSMDILDPSNLERLFTYAAYKIDYKGKIDYEQMKSDIKRIQREIEACEKEIHECETEFKQATFSDTENFMRTRDALMNARSEANNVRNQEGIPLKKYGIPTTMLQYLQDLIWAEDIESDDEIVNRMGRVRSNNPHHILMDTHTTTAEIATVRWRKATEKSGSNHDVIILETAHPDKFPDALAVHGLRTEEDEKHYKLRPIQERIERREKPQTPDPIHTIEEVLDAVHSMAQTML